MAGRSRNDPLIRDALVDLWDSAECGHVCQRWTAVEVRSAVLHLTGRRYSTQSVQDAGRRVAKGQAQGSERMAIDTPRGSVEIHVSRLTDSLVCSYGAGVFTVHLLPRGDR